MKEAGQYLTKLFDLVSSLANHSASLTLMYQQPDPMTSWCVWALQYRQTNWTTIHDINNSLGLDNFALRFVNDHIIASSAPTVTEVQSASARLFACM